MRSHVQVARTLLSARLQLSGQEWQMCGGDRTTGCSANQPRKSGLKCFLTKYSSLIGSPRVVVKISSAIGGKLEEIHQRASVTLMRYDVGPPVPDGQIRALELGGQSRTIIDRANLYRSQQSAAREGLRASHHWGSFRPVGRSENMRRIHSKGIFPGAGGTQHDSPDGLQIPAAPEGSSGRAGSGVSFAAESDICTRLFLARA
jgi:hypothetical protein